MFGYGFGGYTSYFRGSTRSGEVDYMNVKQDYFSPSGLLAAAKRSGAGGVDEDYTARTLDDILRSTEDAPATSAAAAGEAMRDDAGAAALAAGSAAAAAAADHSQCCECEATASETFCPECGDAFCALCFTVNHRKGRRALHRPVPIAAAAAADAGAGAADDGTGITTSSAAVSASAIAAMTVAQDAASSAKAAAMTSDESERLAELISADSGSLPEWWRGRAIAADWFLERARHIPLRLTHEERKLLRLLQGVLRSSSYADRVDKPFKSRAARVRACLLEVVSVLTALVAGADQDVGRRVLKGADLAPLAPFFQNVFELGRRHKIRNPEKMRLSYGQLMFLLQDAQMPEVQEQLGFSCVRPVRTVYDLLEERGALGVLRDPRLAVATQIVVHHGKERAEIEATKQRRDRAMRELLDTHASREIGRETLSMAIYSITDNHSFLYTSRDHCNALIDLLQHCFRPAGYDEADPTTSLAIAEGSDGARLTHSHAAQYHYVLQSLCLWRDLLDDFFRLWSLAELDLLDVTGELGLGAPNAYELRETGQGLHRVQQAPRTDRALRKIVHGVQSRAQQHWVGSSVIHLGDNNVPNAYAFIDKYNQVARILAPVVICLNGLEQFRSNENKIVGKRVPELITLGYRDWDHARRAILSDFFRSAFDGSGSESFFEAGSCIDGRLTSAWNWCNQLPSKHFFPLFLMTGFVGFDGADFDG